MQDRQARSLVFNYDGWLRLKWKNEDIIIGKLYTELKIIDINYNYINTNEIFGNDNDIFLNFYIFNQNYNK